ncbi:chalcone--flavanone isomerase-like [Bidens hawaiensis]|uniref:chalcone--flavanone isomerase-like n=1 Tax=Bidens hawaiensis TaxID=980011 RepID=UPI004049810B
MANLPSVTDIQVESIVFSPSIKPPGATNTLFLGGAGVRCLEIEGKIVKVSTTGVYLEDKAVQSLAFKWKGKSAEELNDSDEFYKDIITGSFEKCIRVTPILPLAGKQISGKVSETSVAILKTHGTYTDAHDTIINKFLDAFKDENFPPGSFILFTVSPVGLTTISFSNDGTIPEAANVVLENEQLGQAMIEMLIGKHGVSPGAKQTLASRLADLMN